MTIICYRSFILFLIKKKMHVAKNERNISCFEKEKLEKPTVIHAHRGPEKVYKQNERTS